MIMNDQASALRQLKRLVEISSQEPIPTPEEFLASIQRPTPFLSVAAIVPDKIGRDIPPLQSWIDHVLASPQRSCIWDQAGILSAATPPLENANSLLPAAHSIEGTHGPLTLIARNPLMLEIHQKQVPDRIRFVRQLNRLLVPFQEFWITLQAGEINFHQPVLHGTDLAIVIVPESQDSVIRGYEAVKSVRLSGYFSPIALLHLTEQEVPPQDNCLERILSVAKQFLALDLLSSRLVLSPGGAGDESRRSVRAILDSTSPEQRDFLFYLSERLIYPAPGDNR